MTIHSRRVAAIFHRRPPRPGVPGLATQGPRGQGTQAGTFRRDAKRSASPHAQRSTPPRSENALPVIGRLRASVRTNEPARRPTAAESSPRSRHTPTSAPHGFGPSPRPIVRTNPRTPRIPYRQAGCDQGPASEAAACKAENRAAACRAGPPESPPGPGPETRIPNPAQHRPSTPADPRLQCDKPNPGATHPPSPPANPPPQPPTDHGTREADADQHRNRLPTPFLPRPRFFPRFFRKN
mgnify:CR=1 FL=1